MIDENENEQDAPRRTGLVRQVPQMPRVPDRAPRAPAALVPPVPGKTVRRPAPVVPPAFSSQAGLASYTGAQAPVPAPTGYPRPPEPRRPPELTRAQREAMISVPAHLRGGSGAQVADAVGEGLSVTGEDGVGKAAGKGFLSGALAGVSAHQAGAAAGLAADRGAQQERPDEAKGAPEVIESVPSHLRAVPEPDLPVPGAAGVEALSEVVADSVRPSLTSLPAGEALRAIQVAQRLERFPELRGVEVAQGNAARFPELAAEPEPERSQPEGHEGDHGR